MKNTYTSYRNEVIEIELNFQNLTKEELMNIPLLARKYLKLGYYDLYGWLMFTFCNAHLQGRETEKVAIYMTELKQIADEQKGYPLIYYLLLEGVSEAFFKLNLEKGIDNAETALKVYKTSKFDDQLVLYYIYQALFSFYTMKNDIVTAYRYSYEALNCKLHKIFVSKKASTYAWLGELELKHTLNYKQAIHNILKAAEIHKKSNNIAHYATSLNRLADIYVINNKYNDGILKAKEAIAIARENNYVYWEVTFHLTLGMSYRLNADIVKAEESFQYILNSQLKIDPITKNATFIELGKLYFSLNDWDNAVKQLKLSIDLLIEIKNNSLLFDSYLFLTKIYKNQENYGKMIDVIMKAQELLSENNTPENVMNLNEALYHYYKSVGKYKEAVQHLEKYVEMMKQIDEMRTKLNLEINEIRFELRSKGGG